ncbi:MAG: hypothetical protein ABI271_04255 [Nitrosospira sp.]
MRSITVAARDSDPRMFRAQKYSKVVYLRKTTPEPQLLTSLAAFLVEHIDGCVAGEMSDLEGKSMVLYSAKSEAQVLRERTPGRPTENIINHQGLDKIQAKIGGWQFLPIEPEQSDTEYWNTQANRLLAAGVTRIVIGKATFLLG